MWLKPVILRTQEALTGLWIECQASFEQGTLFFHTLEGLTSSVSSSLYFSNILQVLQVSAFFKFTSKYTEKCFHKWNFYLFSIETSCFTNGHLRTLAWVLVVALLLSDTNLIRFCRSPRVCLWRKKWDTRPSTTCSLHPILRWSFLHQVLPTMVCGLSLVQNNTANWSWTETYKLSMKINLYVNIVK